MAAIGYQFRVVHKIEFIKLNLLKLLSRDARMSPSTVIIVYLYSPPNYVGAYTVDSCIFLDRTIAKAAA